MAPSLGLLNPLQFLRLIFLRFYEKPYLIEFLPHTLYSVGLSIIGIIPGVLASFYVALNAILTKRYLSVVDGSILRLGLRNNINAAVIFLPFLVFSGEISVLLDYKGLATTWFWTIMLISGFLGFAVGAVSALQIKVRC